MSKNFEKLQSKIEYYKKIIDKDPFIILNLTPLKFLSGVGAPNPSKIDLSEDKYSNFIKNHGKEYIINIIDSLCDMPIVYSEILKEAKEKEEELKRNRGFKISEAKIEISPNVIAKGIFDKQEQHKLKAACNYKIGLSFYKEKNYNESRKAFEEAWNYDQNNPEIINNIFITNYLMGNFNKIPEILKIMAILGFKEIEFFTK